MSTQVILPAMKSAALFAWFCTVSILLAAPAAPDRMLQQEQKQQQLKSLQTIGQR